MSLHIGAEDGEIAETVLLSGDPLRAQHVAETMLSESKCYSTIRNMLGFTGYYNGKKISVQGSGMGQPSLAIYLHELVHDYGVKTIIRIGTCGALNEKIGLGDVIIALGASTDSNMNRLLFNGQDYAPTANFELLLRAHQKAGELGIDAVVGDVFSTDFFYRANDPERWQPWIAQEILCTDMETSALYTLAAGAGVRALSILTVSDHIISNVFSSKEERERYFMDMVKIALECSE